MKSKDLYYPKITVNINMKDHSRDPYITNKVEEMKEFIKKAGFPSEILRIQAERLKK